MISPLMQRYLDKEIDLEGYFAELFAQAFARLDIPNTPEPMEVCHERD